jgi:nucleotide-binding universal stress UspA family protein
MFHKIMVALDESPEADKALQAAIELARELPADVTVVSVIEPFPAYYSFSVTAHPASEWRENKRKLYASLQARARRRARATGLLIETELVDGDEVSSIIACARRHGVDLLVLGMPKYRVVIGSTGRDIAERSPCALLGIR